MAALPIETEFNEYWSRLTLVEKESLLIVAKNYIQLKEDNVRIGLTQYNNEIDEAMQSIDNGESYTHEAVAELSKTWLNGR